MIPSPESFHLPSRADGKRVLQALAARFPAKREPVPSRRFTFYDTFDWRLYRAGWALEMSGGGPPATLRWQTLDGRLCERLKMSGEPAFAWDLPAGSLRDALSPIIEMRRLLPLVHLEASGETLRILDANRKTVARVVLHQASASPEENRSQAEDLPTTLEALPVRGYQQAFAELTDFLREKLELETATTGPLDLALAAVDRRPGDYSSKLEVQLAPEQRADEAVKRIFRSLLATIVANEAGVRTNLDSEFLHDFRVAVRRTRSALSQLKGLYAKAEVKEFEQEFRWLGRLTGPSRDLDVYLLKMADYRELLPETVRGDLQPLEEFLERHRELEYGKMVAALSSTRYRDLLQRWQSFLDQPAATGELPLNAATPVADLASRRIWKACRRVLEKGRAIGNDTPPEALHRLRIEAKKLRYLLEFFSSLYDAEEIARLVKELKKLQTNLGDFNDFVVQQATLGRFAEELARETPGSAKTLMAMGRLQEHLEIGQERERQDFHRRFARFSAPGNRQRFRRLFEAPEISER